MKLLGLSLAAALVVGAASVARAEGPPTVPETPPSREFVGFEGTVGASTNLSHDDAYANRLRDFGFEHESMTVARYAFTVDLHLLEHLAVGATFFNTDAQDYTRDNQGIDQTFTWSSHAIGGFVQGDIGIDEGRPVVFFGRLGAGVAYGTSVLDEIVVEGDFSEDDGPPDSYQAHTREAEESFSGYYIGGSLGMQVMPSERVGLLLEIRYVHAPALENLTGETHDLGSLAMMFGLRIRTWR